jgi:hypothetical protein
LVIRYELNFSSTALSIPVYRLELEKILERLEARHRHGREVDLLKCSQGFSVGWGPGVRTESLRPVRTYCGGCAHIVANETMTT